MIKYILDYIFGRDVDTILSTMSAASRRLERLKEREAAKRSRITDVQELLAIAIADLDKDWNASVDQSDRAERVQQRINELLA